MLLVVNARSLLAQGRPPRDSLARDSAGARITLDSLAARLERTEAALALLRQQVATESATQVRMRSRVQLELSARLIVNGWRTSGIGSSSEVPTFAAVARPVDPLFGSAGRQSLGLSMRQSVVGASVSVDSVLGGVLLADMELDFFSRALDPNPPLFPEPRLRTARAILVWPRTEILVGMETPLISDLTPITAAGVAIPTFAAAGNLWNWLPQLRVTRELWQHSRSPISIALQGAVMSPFSVERHVTDAAGPDAGQLSGRPALESRVRLRWGGSDDVAGLQALLTQGGEIGVGTHRGWLRAVGDSNTTSWATSADARVALGHGVELRGEAYRGRLLRGLGGAAIGQNFGLLGNNVDRPGVPLTNAAGWVQLNGQWHPRVIAGVGCGTDRVLGSSADRRRNSVCAVHAMWRPAQPLLVSFEWRDLRTRYAAGVQHARHLNIGFGIEL